MGLLVQLGRRNDERPHLESLRTPSPISYTWSAYRRSSDVSASKRRKFPFHGGKRNPIWHHCFDASRHFHQHGNATLQDACRRHGQREAERSCLFNPKLPLQRRLNRGIYIPDIIGMDRTSKHGLTVSYPPPSYGLSTSEPPFCLFASSILL